MSGNPTSARNAHDLNRVIALERRVLALLCQSDDKLVRERANQMLAGHTWKEAAHEALFHVLMSFPSTNRQALRDRLPALLTRRGFPDFDFEALYTQPLTSGPEAEACIRELAQAG